MGRQPKPYHRVQLTDPTDENYLDINSAGAALTMPIHLAVANGDVVGWESNKQHGEVEASTAWQQVIVGGIYQMPTYDLAVPVRIAAGGDAADDAAGTGARAVTICGRDATGLLVTETLVTAGVSASAYSTTSFARICKSWVSASGSYFATGTNSHAATITIEDSAANVWATIETETGLGRGESECACYTVGLDQQAFITGISLSSDANKVTDINLAIRENADGIIAPFTSFRTFKEWRDIQGGRDEQPLLPWGPFPAHTDIICSARVAATTAIVEVSLDLAISDV